MRHLFVPALTAIVLGAAAIATSGAASAAPVGPAGIERPASGLDQVRMRRHHRMMRHRMMRRRAPSQSGNSRDPSRRPMQQNQGQTTGGPRY